MYASDSPLAFVIASTFLADELARRAWVINTPTRSSAAMTNAVSTEYCVMEANNENERCVDGTGDQSGVLVQAGR